MTSVSPGGGGTGVRGEGEEVGVLSDEAAEWLCITWYQSATFLVYTTTTVDARWQ